MSQRNRERRRFSRRRLACPVTVYAHDDSLPVTCSAANVGAGGVYLSMPPGTALPARKRLELTISVPRPGARPQVFAAEARVVRRQSRAGHGAGVAVEFASPVDLPGN